jgi:hypothetical protein
MKSTRLIIIVSIIAGWNQFTLAQSSTKPDLREAKSSRSDYGKWLDGDGFLIPGPKTADFVDVDQDAIDDRLQSAPGKPAGKYRPDKGDLNDRSLPEKPTIPPAGDSTGSKDGKQELGRPEKPSRPSLSSDLKDQLAVYKSESDALRAELKAELKKLNNPTRDQIRQLTAQFQEQNKERLAKQKELADTIKSEFAKVRPSRPPKPTISKDASDKMALLRKEHDFLKSSVSESKSELKAQLANATSEEREVLLGKFRDDQKRLHEDMKNVQRKIRELMSSSLVSGDAVSSIRDKQRRPPSRESIPSTGERRNSDR